MSEQITETLQFPKGTEEAVESIRLLQPGLGEVLLEGLVMANADVDDYYMLAYQLKEAAIRDIQESLSLDDLSPKRIVQFQKALSTAEDDDEIIITNVQEMKAIIEGFAQVRPFTSATTLLFCDGKLVLLILENDAQNRPCIPERGQLKLPGGANGGLVGPNYSWEELADAQLQKWLGISLMDLPHTGFTACEYDMSTINSPLKSPFGELHPDLATIENKRQSHVFAAHIEPEHLEKRVLGKGVQDILLVDSYGELTALQDAGRISFPHEMPAIRYAYEHSRVTFIEDVVKLGD